MKRTPLIVAAVLGMLAVLMVYSYIHRIKVSVTRGMEMVRVIVAGRPIAKGEPLTSANVAYRDVPKRYVGDRAISGKKDELALVMGQPAIYNLQEGQPILWSDIGMEKPEGLSSVIGMGERAVTISVGEITGVGGLIQPNDHVDILWSFDASEYGAVAPREGAIPTDMKGMQEMMRASVQMAEAKTAVITLLQNVTVLATGRLLPMPGMAGRTVQYSNITFLVTPSEAQMLVFAQERGKITLVLRKREDLEISEDLPKLTDQEMLSQVWPQKLTKERKERIEVIRGKQK